MLKIDPKERPSAQEILQFSLFQEINEVEELRKKVSDYEKIIYSQQELIKKQQEQMNKHSGKEK